MERFREYLRLAFLILFLTASSGWTQGRAGDSGEEVHVGRIAHVEGQLLRYVPEEKNWVATVKDAPFGLDDSLYSEAKAKAELIMPNSDWIRIGGNTQIQLIALRMDVTEVDVASGMVRSCNRSTNAVIKVTSPFGYLVAPAGAVFDLYVGDQSLEIISLQGKVDFILNRDQMRYEVIAGSSSLISDGQQVASGQRSVDTHWSDWNAERDRLWSKRTEVKGDSVRYLPPNLQDDAYSLDENGRWERVYYEGGYRYFWRPVNISSGWAPFTMGRWTVYYGDNCWIPNEPFGYLTHHYGNWVFADSSNCWYWAPPILGVGGSIGPFLAIPFGWYPGRVGWIYSGLNIGWVPLAPFEPYYCHRSWGPRVTVVNNVNITNININRYEYINRAIIINQKNFYHVNNYQNVRIANINRDSIVNTYRAAPVINNRIIPNYNSISDKYHFTNVGVNQKPHDMVTQRIARNEQRAKQNKGISADLIRRDVFARQPGNPLQDARLLPPRISDKLVGGGAITKARTDLELQRRDLKAGARPPRPGGESPAVQPGQSGRALSEGYRGGTPRLGGEAQTTEQGQARPAPRDGTTTRLSGPQQILRSPDLALPGHAADQSRPTRPGTLRGELQPHQSQPHPGGTGQPSVPPQPRNEPSPSHIQKQPRNQAPGHPTPNAAALPPHPQVESGGNKGKQIHQAVPPAPPAPRKGREATRQQGEP
jgi:hypothetical protein